MKHKLYYESSIWTGSDHLVFETPIEGDLTLENIQAHAEAHKAERQKIEDTLKPIVDKAMAERLVTDINNGLTNLRALGLPAPLNTVLALPDGTELAIKADEDDANS